ncbi:phage terminase large subunit family protein [Hydrogenophaga aromaticivorans]|uniref:phage terminase large subunit family protein n=1 Tax=Hydrogenophaga aromaticivorans TaxID=2610898 RepID=UPI001FFCBFF0|nr:terminase gpA endonuclease subunit [Hydrogenophaga aromaticivorans]
MTTMHPLVHAETAAAIKAAVRIGLESLRAEPPQRLGDWAQEHFKLAGESSHQKGAWIAWLFQVGILDFMSDDRIEELDVMKAKRVGYTKMVTAKICYNIAHRRRKQALWQPTDDDRDSYVKSEIDPILDPVNGVQAINKARKLGKAHEDTIKYKPFRDSALHLLGGKASRAYRRITLDDAILDEISKFDRTIEKSGPPRGLARGRLEGAPYPKLICGSTPLLKGLCHIEDAVNEAEGLVRFHIDCIHCGLEHPLMWGGKKLAHGFKWTRGKPETVHHVCPHCREAITQADYMPAGLPVGGSWVCERTGKRYGPDRIWRDNAGMPCNPPRTLGVHVWTAYSPQRAWSDIVDEFEKALKSLEAGDTGPMQLFVNETLGETWELAGERTDEHALQARAEPYKLCTVPKGGLELTAGVDVQRNRWEITVYAWGRGMESWVVDVVVIEGNPAVDEEWDAVTLQLQRRYRQEWHGGSLGLSAISIDAGDQTQAVYNWVAKAQHVLPQLRAIKGDGNESVNILGPSGLQEVNWRGRKVPHGIKLWRVGVDAAKDLLLGQLSIVSPGPGYVHFSDELPREFYEQLTAEQRVLAKVNGRDAYRWIKRRPRNEQLDNRNYALHAAYGLGMHKYKEEKWARLEASVQPPVDLFSAVQTPVVNTAQPPAQIELPGPHAHQAASRPAAPRKPLARNW